MSVLDDDMMRDVQIHFKKDKDVADVTTGKFRKSAKRGNVPRGKRRTGGAGRAEEEAPLPSAPTRWMRLSRLANRRP